MSASFYKKFENLPPIPQSPGEFYGEMDITLEKSYNEADPVIDNFWGNNSDRRIDKP